MVRIHVSDVLLFAVLQEMMRATQEIALQAVPEATNLRDAIADAIRAFWVQVEATPELQIMQYELFYYFGSKDEFTFAASLRTSTASSKRRET